MTGQQQQDVFGVGVFADNGAVVIQGRTSLELGVELTPREAIRWRSFLDQAIRDAHRERRQEAA
jgi:hypothetical protein